MAFTPDGMFYLSKEDYAPSMDVLGGAARGMLGLQNKEEGVQAILEGADYKTPEGRRAALDQIRAIDPDRWATLNKQNQDYETQELALTKGYNTPVLKTEWRLDVGKKWTNDWANMYLPGQPKGITTLSELNKYLSDLVKSGSMKNTEKNGWLKTYKAEEKVKREAYVSTNASRSGKKSSNLVPSKDVFNANNLGTKLKQTGTFQYKYNQLLKELNSLQEVANKASAANPAANVIIHTELRKRQDALRKQLLELQPKVEEEANAPWLKDATTIFDINAAKYNK